LLVLLTIVTQELAKFINDTKKEQETLKYIVASVKNVRGWFQSV
jgi:hypothetical protein